MATLIGYEPGAVVQLELCVANMTVPLAQVFPPYIKGGHESLKGLSGAQLARTVLELFRDGALEVDANALLKFYDDLKATRLLPGARAYLHVPRPDPAV